MKSRFDLMRYRLIYVGKLYLIHRAEIMKVHVKMNKNYQMFIYTEFGLCNFNKNRYLM